MLPLLPRLRNRQKSRQRNRQNRIFHTPDIRQGETSECGIAALAILLAHHGSPVTLEDLRQQAGTTRLGLTARQLITLARQNGFHAAAYRRTLEDLRHQPLPVIAHSRFIHFVVIEAVTDSHVRINDPGCGPLLLPLHEFAEDYTGIILTVQPLRSAGAGRREQHPLAALLRPMRKGLALAALATLTLQGAVALTAFLLASHGPALTQTATPLLLLSAAGLGVCAAALARHRAGQAAGRALAQGVEHQAGAFMATQDLDWFARRTPGQTANLMAFPATAEAAGCRASRMADAPGLLLLALAAVTGFGPSGLAVGLCGLGAALLTLAMTNRRGTLLSRMEGSLEELAQTPPAVPVPAMLAGIETWLCGGRSDELALRLAGSHAVSLDQAQQSGGRTAGLNALQTLLFLVSLGATALHGLAGAPAGSVLGLSLLAAALHRQAGKLSGLAPALTQLRALAATLRDLTDGTRPQTAEVLPRPASAELTLRLDGETIVLRPGETLAVTGPAGSGKSRLLRAIAGLELMPGADISLNGAPISAAAAQWPGLVLHEDRPLPPFAGTVADNLRLGQSGLADADLMAALETVELWPVLAPRGGLSLMLTPARPGLSGGQLRRLMIARCLLRRPQVLVLDETLDALETDLEERLRQRLTASGMALVLSGARALTAGTVTHTLTLGDRDA
ncbi:cysteine peptidase family C39 domain-containing protein [Pannonibacter indicus]|uniref:cysteine peptidase family C39 domain-containing protein n=1 Tax=Pannonibacter indicus TaxID=466044 RepID=UPI0035B11376